MFQYALTQHHLAFSKGGAGNKYKVGGRGRNSGIVKLNDLQGKVVKELGLCSAIMLLLLGHVMPAHWYNLPWIAVSTQKRNCIYLMQ